MSDFRNIITHPDVREYIGEVAEITAAEHAIFPELPDAAYLGHINAAIDRHHDALLDIIDDIIRDAGEAVIAEQRGSAE